MSSKEEGGSSVAEAPSVHAPTTIPEESTPASPASPSAPLEYEAAPTQSATPATAAAKPPQEGRFIENISTDGSRASAEDNVEAQQQPVAATTAGGVSEAETKLNRVGRSSSNVFRRNSSNTKKRSNSNAQPSRLQAPASSNGRTQQISPTTDSSTQHPSPHPNDHSTPSSEGGAGSGGGRYFRAFKKIKGDRSDNSSEKQNGPDHGHQHEHGNVGRDEENDHDDEQHPILAALYPLTNFIGYRPLSHPHTPPDKRRGPKHPKFNRFHWICGKILTFGLPVSGDTGQLARYRDAETGEIHLVTMYKDQVGAKIVNSIHSVIAAWVIIALLCLVSRSPFHREHHAPLIIGAFATEAVVTFFAYRTPLAQPKNIMFGNVISSVIGVAMEKAFNHTNYDLNGVYGVDWAAAATAVAAAIFAMQILGFTHPPGAAISLLSLTSKGTNQLSWWLIPIVVIASCIVIGWALLINNLGGRRWPDNWFYHNAFADPPIVGPEQLPFSNSPWQPYARKNGQMRKRQQHQNEDGTGGEKGFYRDSGARISSQGFGQYSNRKAVPAASSFSQNGGDTARMKKTSWSVADNGPDASGSKQGLGTANSNNNHNSNSSNGEDGRTTRNSEVTKVDSTESNPAPRSAAEGVAAGAGEGAVVGGAGAGAGASGSAGEGAVRSRMIETDATVITRNNSKGSKKSRRSVVIHVNENRRHSTGSSSKAPPVPAVQWRNNRD